jgi:hypothetical protein
MLLSPSAALPHILLFNMPLYLLNNLASTAIVFKTYQKGTAHQHCQPIVSPLWN